MPYTELMFDVESFGKDPVKKPLIVSIAGITFNFDDQDTIQSMNDTNRSFMYLLDLNKQTDKGRSMEYDTVLWWLKQSRSARDALDGNRVAVGQSIRTINSICENNGVQKIWGNGNVFDNVMVKDLYRDFNVQYPVSFRDDLDMRTVLYLAEKISGEPVSLEVDGLVKHNPLDDCKYQVLKIQKAWRIINGTESR